MSEQPFDFMIPGLTACMLVDLATAPEEVRRDLADDIDDDEHGFSRYGILKPSIDADGDIQLDYTEYLKLREILIMCRYIAHVVPKKKNINIDLNDREIMKDLSIAVRSRAAFFIAHITNEMGTYPLHMPPLANFNLDVDKQ